MSKTEKLLNRLRGNTVKDILTYKGFIGSVHFSADDRVFHGKIEGIDDLVTFEDNTVDGLVKAFREEADDYVELCMAQNKDPLRAYKGSFNVRISPELHRKAVATAKTIGITLNSFVQAVNEKELANKG